MKYNLFKKEDYKSSQWMGGTTTELALFPQGTSYLDRNFMWRLSSAVIEKDESDFTRLPDYDRVLMVLEGEVVLSYEGERVARLKELEQDRFDGGWKTKSFGRITDFNLMVRKGMEGYLDVLLPTGEKQQCGSTEESELSMATHALYCKDGYCVVTFGGDSHMLSPGQLMVLEYEAGETPDYSIMGEGTVIRGQIFYNRMQDEIAPEIITAEKATFDDFKACVFLANTQFRG
ncbi:MAG: HutD family protein, partial [Firmicutes bacterium]|nr:HutD family protein [Bacillota bacterium]